MKKILTSMTLDYDLTINHKFIDLVKQRKLSETINELLRSYLAIGKIVVPEDETKLDEAIKKVNSEKLVLEQKKNALIEKRAKDKKNAPTHRIIRSMMDRGL